MSEPAPRRFGGYRTYWPIYDALRQGPGLAKVLAERNLEQRVNSRESADDRSAPEPVRT